VVPEVRQDATRLEHQLNAAATMTHKTPKNVQVQSSNSRCVQQQTYDKVQPWTDDGDKGDEEDDGKFADVLSIICSVTINKLMCNVLRLIKVFNVNLLLHTTKYRAKEVHFFHRVLKAQSAVIRLYRFR
jgi:hypothetical protein